MDGGGTCYRYRRTMPLLLIPFLISLLAASSFALNGELVEQECPVDCHCHYFRINWVTDCSESNLTGIPYDELSPNVYILDMNGNNIAQVGPFPRDIKLRRLQMAHNQLTELKHESFAALTYLLDADFSWNNIRRVDPEAFSLILGNYLAQHGAAARDILKACLVISVPWNVFEATKNTEESYVNLMINMHLASNLRRSIQRYHYSMEDRIFNMDMDVVLKSRTVREFDTYFTAKQFGYKDVEEYYSNATIHDKLHLIEVPVLCLSAADDPFQPLKAIPLDEIRNTKNVAAVVTSRGGHIGFLEGFWPLKDEQYIGKLFAQFFNAVFTIGADHPAF